MTPLGGTYLIPYCIGNVWEYPPPRVQSFFIFCLNAFLVSVCTKGFAYLLCSLQGRGIRLLVCKWGLSFHEFYNFLLSNFLILIFFGNYFLSGPARVEVPCRPSEF